MKRWARLLGLLLGVAATIAVAVYAARTFHEQDLSRYLSAGAIGGIAIAAIAYSIIIPLSALAWREMLRDLKVRREWSELGIIMSVTQLAKYIPGNLGQHIGRAAMAINRGVPLRAYGVSVACEAVLAVVAATAVGLTGFGLTAPGLEIPHVGSARLAPYLALFICVFVAMFIAGRRALPRMLARFSAGGPPVSLPRNRTLIFALFVYVANYVVFGTGVTAMAAMLLPGQNSHWLLLTGGFALAWVVGFFAPGAPAGLGVREGLLLALLQSSYTRVDALAIVIAMRIATTAGDVLCFAVGGAAHLVRTVRSRHTCIAKDDNDDET
jgi:hypothetical protein